MPPVSGTPNLSGAAKPPECWTRLEFSEHRFVEQCAGHTDGVVIPLGFDTTSQPGAAPVLRSRLKAAALASRTPFLIDLDTWRLPYLTGRDDRTLERDAATVMAQAVSLPLTPKALHEAQTLLSLVRTGMTAQVGAGRMFAPDFQFESLDDPWLDVNLRALVMARTLAGATPVGAWIHVTLETMLSGTLALVAERYAARLPAGATVALTVSDMRPILTPDELATYFRALEAFRGAGLRVIVDRAGDATIPAAGLFADGCILGTRLYRTAPPTPHFTSEYNPRVKLKYFVGLQGRRVPRDLASKRHAAGRLADCEHPGCEAVGATASKGNIPVRLHSAHELRAAVRRAHLLGQAALLAEWRDAKLAHLRCWAQAIALASERSEEA
jgi:hypothetical protein